jgi:hypothetical protein
VLSMAQGSGVCQEVPSVDLSGLIGAIAAVLSDRLLGRDNGKEFHLELVDSDVGLMHVEQELASENGTRRRLRVVVEYHWRRLYAHIHGCSHVRFELWAVLWRSLGRTLVCLLGAIMAVESHEWKTSHNDILL